MKQMAVLVTEAQDDASYGKYFGRLVLRYHNPCRTMGRTYASVMDELEVLEILNDQFTGEDFPGYENVRLSYRQLKNVIDQHLPGWIAALQNQKAVYLITDNKTVIYMFALPTSQTGMLLQRSSNYIADGHGGNESIKRARKKAGLRLCKRKFPVFYP